jgi:hypothetical protein
LPTTAGEPRPHLAQPIGDRVPAHEPRHPIYIPLSLADTPERTRSYASKNVGDAFQVVWRPPKTGGLEAIKDMGAESNIADKALTSIVASAELVNYDSKLKALLEGNATLQQRMPGFRCVRACTRRGCALTDSGARFDAARRRL